MRKMIILAVLLFSSQVFGAFNIINPVPRAMGMGNAFVAVADDVSAVFYNPAGLAGLKSWETTFSYSKLYVGISNLDESFIAAGMPLGGLGSVGVSWYKYYTGLYTEDVFSFAYAYKISSIKTSLGVNVKYLVKGYTANEWTIGNPFFLTDSGADLLSVNALSYGVSLLSGYLIKNLTIGLFVDDINNPNVALKGEEILPKTIRGGAAYAIDKNIVVSTELFYRGGDYKLHLGGEIVGFKAGDAGILSFRAGGGFGTSNYLNATAGFGFRFNIPGLDLGSDINYGFLFPVGFAEGSSGTHKIALTIREGYKELKGKNVEQEAVSAASVRAEKVDNKATIEKEKIDQNFAAKTVDTGILLKGANEKAVYNTAVSGAVRSEFIKSGKFNVLEKTKFEELLNSKNLKLPGCTTKECAVEAGKILKVEYVLIGSVKVAGKNTDLSIKLIETTTGKAMLIDRKYDSPETLTLGIEKIVGQVATSKRFLDMKLSVAILNLEDLSVVEPLPRAK